jgi:hypothetical protein
MIAAEKSHGYSADVRMHLHVNGHTFLVGHLGPSFVILDDPVDHPPAMGEIIMSIDGRVKRWPVQLPGGVSTSEPRTQITSVDANSSD